MSLLDHPRVNRLAGELVSAVDKPEQISVDDRNSWRLLEQMACLLILFLLGWRLMLRSGMTFGFLAALLMCPIWIGVIRRYRHGALLFVAAMITLGSGLVLSAFARQEYRYVSIGSVIAESNLWIGTMAGVGVMLWARSLLKLSWISVAFGLGMLLRNITHPDELAATNGWKFIYSIPLTVIALGIASSHRSRRASLVVLVVLAGVSAVLDSRSLLGTLMLSAVLVGWQLRPRSGSRPLAWGWSVVLLAGLAAAIYNLATSLMLEGYLGETIQQRSQVQVRTAGSLILGGRPELAASLALFTHDPRGFGLGVAPNIHDLMVAKTGMTKINYDPDNGYVDRYMFGGHVELHSTAGDMWAMFGLAGIAMAVLIGLLGIRGVAHSMSARDGNSLLIFTVCFTLWNLPFGPLYASVPTLILALGLMLSTRDGNRETFSHDPPQDGV